MSVIELGKKTAAYLLGCGLVVVLSACTVSPQPLTDNEIVREIEADQQAIFTGQEPIAGPMSLNDAMARALKYNLENRVKLMEEAMAWKNFDLAKTDMLPTLAASGGYLDRSNEDASRSISVLTRRESLEPSTSQEQDRLNADIRLSWNVLDFGVSYLQAKQDADNILISQQTRKKVMLNLLQRVRLAYWRAVAMNSMRDELTIISTKTNAMLEKLQKVRAEQLRTPVAILMDIRGLVETSQRLDQIQHSINVSKKELASLINVPMANEIPLLRDDVLEPMALISDDLDAFERTALLHSADYVNQIYSVRIDQLETRKALARLLPGLEFSYGEYYNSNNFLWNSQWGEVGIRMTSNLSRLIYQDKIRAVREANKNVAQARRMAINMAVVSNVHLAWQQYHNALQSLDRAEFLNEIDQEISRLSSTAKTTASGSGIDAIQNEFRAFRSRMAGLMSYAETQASYGYFLVSLGIDPVPEDYQAYSLDELAKMLEQGFAGALAEIAPAAMSPPNAGQGQAPILEKPNHPLWKKLNSDSVEARTFLQSSKVMIDYFDNRS